MLAVVEEIRRVSDELHPPGSNVIAPLSLAGPVTFHKGGEVLALK